MLNRPMMNEAGFITKTFIIILIIAGLLIGGVWFFLYQPLIRKKKFEQAFSLVERGDYQAAVPVLEKIAHSSFHFRDREKTVQALARSYTELKNYQRAWPLWERLVSQAASPYREEGQYYLGRLAAEMGEIEKAERILSEHIRLYPHSSWGGEVQLALGRIKKSSNRFLEAREAYRRVLENYPNSPAVEQAQKELGELNLRILGSPLIDDGSQEYTVEVGDTLTAIAALFHTTPELLQKSNRLAGTSIQPGQKLKVPRHRFEAVVSKSQNTLMLIYGGKFFKMYPVGTGAEDCTPKGNFTIISKLIEPPWFQPGEVIPSGDQRNILGSRWMGFDQPYEKYGIHGTTEPETIGTQSSAGCIRMLNQDVEEIYDLFPRGTKVTVVD